MAARKLRQFPGLGSSRITYAVPSQEEENLRWTIDPLCHHQV